MNPLELRNALTSAAGQPARRLLRNRAKTGVVAESDGPALDIPAEIDDRELSACEEHAAHGRPSNRRAAST